MSESLADASQIGGTPNVPGDPTESREGRRGSVVATAGPDAVSGYVWEELLSRLPPERRRSLAVLVAVASHPFLDWLTTYAVAFFAPLGDRWYSANAIFIYLATLGVRFLRVTPPDVKALKKVSGMMLSRKPVIVCSCALST